MAKMYDCIVIGSGIAGLNFALRMAEKKKRVLVITKKKIANAATNFAQGGIAAVLSQLDNYKKHIHDTLVAGCFHNNVRAVAYVVKHGPAAISRLIELGVPFATEEGKLALTRKDAPLGRSNNLAELRLGLEGGHSERRIAFVSDYTGQAIEKALILRARKNPYITLYEDTFAADLLVKNRTCYGVQIVKQQKFENIFGRITVMATGGIGQLYENTTNPEISTGDGIAMAARCGCNFRDLEFVQFHPTALKLNGKPRFLISEAVRGEGAYLRNAKGERFMASYDKRKELAPRDIVSRAIFEEEKKGPVFLDLRHKNERFIKTRFPTIYETLLKHGTNMTKDLIPISPAAHYECGGIKVNLLGETGIKNLCAFGEVAGTGVHGANRLASNSLLEALVFSDRIVKEQKKQGRSTKIPRFVAPRFTPLSRKDKKMVLALRKKLQRVMWEYVGIVRSKKSLAEALKQIAQLKKQARDILSNAPEILELKNMIQASELITKAALARKNNLGCHYRTT